MPNEAMSEAASHLDLFAMAAYVVRRGEISGVSGCKSARLRY
jgi:hypothetical protein